MSFEVLQNGDVQVQIVLKKMTHIEEDYIEDISVEFSSKQQEDCVLSPIVKIGIDNPPLKNLIYQQL